MGCVLKKNLGYFPQRQAPVPFVPDKIKIFRATHYHTVIGGDIQISEFANLHRWRLRMIMCTSHRKTLMAQPYNGFTASYQRCMSSNSVFVNSPTLQLQQQKMAICCVNECTVCAPNFSAAAKLVHVFCIHIKHFTNWTFSFASNFIVISLCRCLLNVLC